MATTPRSRCPARLTCSARVAFSKNCGGASARTSVPRSSWGISSDCCGISDPADIKERGRLLLLVRYQLSLRSLVSHAMRAHLDGCGVSANQFANHLRPAQARASLSSGAWPLGRGNVVRFEHVGLRYGLGPEVLHDLTFRIDARSFQFITEPSGAGKSSLLRLLFLSLRPTRGLVTLF